MDTGKGALGHGHWKRDTRARTLARDTRTQAIIGDTKRGPLGHGHEGGALG